MALFIGRAQAARPDFQVTNENRPPWRKSAGGSTGCRWRSSSAAARVKMLPPRRLLARLGKSFKLVTGGARDLTGRQQTLRAAIDWSYSLLSESEKTLFRRLAVFAGGRSMDAIEAVCGDPDSFDAFDAVASLVDKSLLRQDETSDGEPRFVMLETLHEYARERLDESGEGDEIHREGRRKLFSRLAKTLFNEWGDSHDPQGHVRPAREQDNFRAALSTLIDARSAQVLGLTRRLWGSWLFRGQLDEGQRWVRGALDAATDAEPEERAWMLGVLGEFPRFRGEHADALEIKEEALAAGRALSLDRAIKATLCDMAESLAHNGDLDRAKALVQEALEIEAGSAIPGKPAPKPAAAEVAMVSGDFEAAAARYEQMIDAYRPHKDREMMVSYSWALGSLGECRRRAGDADGARTCFKEALAVAVPYGIFTWLPEALHGIADIAAPSAPSRAAVLLGAAQAFRTETGLAGDPATFAQIEECVAQPVDSGGIRSCARGGSFKVDRGGRDLCAGDTRDHAVLQPQALRAPEAPGQLQQVGSG